MAKFKKTLIQMISLIGAASFAVGFCVDSFKSIDSSANTETKSGITKMNASVKTNQEDYYDPNVIYKLPETVSQNEEVSVIVSMNTGSVIDAYGKAKSSLSLTDYANSGDARKVRNEVNEDRNDLLKKLRKSGISYEIGAQYDTVLSGFEIVIKGKDYAKVGEVLGDSATLILSETYEAAVTEVVTNDVDVYHTGIFDSSSSAYQGDGVVVAVLDTGLDYTHSVFNPDYMQTAEKDLAWELSDFTPELIGSTAAARFTSGLQGEDVYVNKKVPYAYDYADKDADVFPINSEHGTHVAGTIAGYDPNGYYDKDGTYYDQPFTGVAPNAQLAIMKVFSDMTDGAKTSWILAALEDCVKLGVDVINMSLGSGCGFTTERDEQEVSEIYESIKQAGISLIASAANSYSSTMGSEKNGNLGLTSNPDTGTVGSPSTYDAALSIASVDGVKTPYLKYGEEIIYFNEATDASATTKNFVAEILKTVGNPDSYEFDYVTIGGTGSYADYLYDSSYYEDKIVLVKRGITTFEEKVKVALIAKKAKGIIIYNNVSGDISMSVGDVTGAVCSISQDDGEMLAKAKTGKLFISKDQVAGPFMSDFSSWGPTSDLKIKPEITSHGGEILSSVPGQKFDRQSGTSMAAPNLAGATALIRQYVKYSDVFGKYKVDIDDLAVTSLVNRLMMSTTDIILNKNGLPYAVRKQGSGLVNITKATTSAAYITTYDQNGNAMDKTKFELGDDKKMTGEYTMTFAIENISGSAVSYNLGAIVMTEGVSETKTGHEETTVTQDGYLLDGARLTVVSVDGQAHTGKQVTVNAHESAMVTVKITLSEADKQYIRDSFENGMYVEGFVTLDAVSGTQVDMSAPFLAFFGDWTQAPIFDEEYYDTNKDELNLGLDQDDKLMADAYATRVIGGLYSDYIATMGEYYFVQDPNATPIAASKEHIALSNQNTEDTATISSINSISAGLLRNVRELNVTIVEDATGRTVFDKVVYNQRKSFNSGGAIYGSSIDMDFDGASRNLKNNTKYTVTVEAYIDYGENEDQSNRRNTFTFPLFIDFEAPTVSNVEYRTEYDKSTNKTKLFADIDIYDNHYAMAIQIGQVTEAIGSKTHLFEMQTFGKYITPVYSSFNSTTTVTVELTDYIEQLKNSAGLEYDENGKYYVVNKNSFVAVCYDYAMNVATFEIPLPDDILSMNFTKNSVELSPNQTLTIDSELLNIYPTDQWLQTLEFESSDPDVVAIVEQTLVAKTSGEATISVKGYDGVELKVKVLSPTDNGYKVISIPQVSKFAVTGYTTNKAYYALSSEEREIGFEGSSYDFGKGYELSMFPSESVTLNVTLQSAFGDRAQLSFSSSKSNIVTVDEKTGEIVAQAEGNADIIVKATFDGKSTYHSQTISVTVKDPFTTMSIYLQSYKGLGGVVTIPNDRGITTIAQYAFSNYEYVPKDTSAGDVIDEEDPYLIKPMYIGEDTITQVIIPEGVTSIEQYAFAKLTALEKVVLPSTLTRIGVGAFLGCTKLKEINLSNVQFINERAFSGCDLEDLEKAETKNAEPFASIVAIGNEAFYGCQLNTLWLPKSAQSLGIGAFRGNEKLMDVEFKASKIKIGSYAFAECTNLLSININAAVVADHAFYGCTNLGKDPLFNEVALGKDVAIIGEYAFAGTSVQKFTFPNGNSLFETEENGALVLKKLEGNEKELVLVAPMYAGVEKVATTTATSIGRGAFAGNSKLKTVVAEQATYIGAYAFAECSLLENVRFSSNLKEISDYAFYCSAIKATPDLSNVDVIGAYAFADTDVTSVEIKPDTKVGDYAFAACMNLTEVKLGNNVTVGEAAFYCPLYIFSYEYTGKFDYYEEYTYTVENPDGEDVHYTYSRYKFDTGVLSRLETVSLGEGVELGAYAFANNPKITTLDILGKGVKIGDYAFFNAILLDNADLSGVVAVGESAFAGTVTRDYHRKTNTEWTYAYERAFIDGEEMLTGYKYTRRACPLVAVSLASAETIGDYAFANNVTLEAITFSDKLTSIGDYAFALAAVKNITLPQTVNSIGAYAFYQAPLQNINLQNVSTIGEYAFAGTLLETVTLKEGIKIADGVFGYCENLANVINLDKAVSVGAYAFAGTKLTVAAIPEATYVGDFAFADSLVANVTLSENLTELGENPFAGCAIESFGRWKEKTVAGNKTVQYFEDSFNVNEDGTVKVIDGVLYQSLKSGGLELVTYPTMNDETAYSVEEGTVRISARTFQDASLESVTLPLSLLAIGDKAFYGCNELKIVIFLSYEAPALEEEYAETYMTYTNLAFTGTVGDGLGNVYEGLGIVPYYMWNYSIGTNFFFGANFVDYIGTLDNKLVMVKPVNGKYYDTFIMQQYFGSVVEGSTAALQTTLQAIALIEALPNHILLSHESEVVAARAAYDLIASTDQQALVTNYSKLTDAERSIAYFKAQEQTNEPVVDNEPVVENAFVTFMQNNAVGLIIAGVLLLGFAAYIVLDKVILPKRKNTKEE